MRIEANSLKLALAAAIGFVGFVVSLASFAGLFGGDWQGYLAAVLVFVVTFVSAYLVQKAAGKRGVSPPEERAEESEMLQDAVSIAPPEVEDSVSENHLVCDSGPHEINGGEMLWLELDVEKGDRVRGHLGETSGQEFDWCIVNEHNLVLAKRREEFSYEAGDEGVTADTVRWTPRRNGPWSLLIDLYRRSNAREVEVVLRRS